MRSNLGRTVRLVTRGTIEKIFSMTSISRTNIAGPADPPASASGLAAVSASATQINLSWADNATDESGWKIEQAPDSSGSPGTWTEIANLVGADITSYSVTGLSASTKYHFRVRPYNTAGDANYTSSASATTDGVPVAPTGFTATSTFADSVSLAWTDASSDETGFDIEVSTNAGGTYSSVTTTAANATSYTHTGRTESTAYLYRIRSTNAAGSSAWVVASSVTTPAALTGLTATATSSTQINLAWTDKSGVETGFRIERSTDNVTFSLVTTTAANATSYSNTGLTASTLYYYRVRSNSYNGTNDSAWYSASATTQSGGLSPSWSLDFSSGTPSGYTLTRASSGTYVGSSGYIASASTDVARLTHNSSGSRLGLLIEGQRTNRAPNSVLLDSWSLVTITRATQTSVSTPRGASVSASKISASAALTSSSAMFFQENALATGDYAFSIYAKADGATFLYLFVADGANDHGRYFDLSNGTMGNTVGTLVSSSMTDAGNGWYRCVITWNNPSSSTRYPAILPSTTNATGRSSQAGTTPNGVLVTAAQFEPASTASSWIETTGASAVTRSADLAHVLDTSITSWGDPGALVVHFYPPGQAGTLISTDDASTAQVGIEASTTTAARAFWSSGSTATGTIGTGVQKAVHYWTGSTSKFCINGGTVQSGTNNLTIGNTDFVTLGAEATDSSGVPGTFSQYANCVIRKVEFYSGTLTDANLQTITT